MHFAFIVPLQIEHSFFKYWSLPLTQYGLWQSCFPCPLHEPHVLGLLESAIVK